MSYGSSIGNGIKTLESALGFLCGAIVSLGLNTGLGVAGAATLNSAGFMNQGNKTITQNEMALNELVGTSITMLPFAALGFFASCCCINSNKQFSDSESFFLGMIAVIAYGIFGVVAPIPGSLIFKQNDDQLKYTVASAAVGTGFLVLPAMLFCVIAGCIAKKIESDKKASENPTHDNRSRVTTAMREQRPVDGVVVEMREQSVIDAGVNPH